jgi:hypothetical protein
MQMFKWLWVGGVCLGFFVLGMAWMDWMSLPARGRWSRKALASFLTPAALLAIFISNALAHVTIR